jgi:hypothetical protein
MYNDSIFMQVEERLRSLIVNELQICTPAQNAGINFLKKLIKKQCLSILLLAFIISKAHCANTKNQSVQMQSSMGKVVLTAQNG